jgi:hypothetical protein
MKNFKEFSQQTGKIINVNYKIIIKDSKGESEQLITDFEIINSEDKKLKIKAKGYIKTYLNGNNYDKKKGWMKFDDFEDNKNRIVWNKNFENGTKKIKVY